MYLVNSFGRIVEMEDEQSIKSFLSANKEHRRASQDEIARYLSERQMMNTRTITAGTFYFQTVSSSPDGYGMSRDHIKRELAEHKIMLNENYGDQKVGLLYNYPYGILSMRTDIRLVYTMFESDKIPEDWADYLDMADEVMVPSKWCHDVFAKAGVETTVVPLGYNDDVFKYQERSVPIVDKKPFTFIHYDSFNMRKGFSEVFKAFTEEFEEHEHVQLILKTAQNGVAVPIMKSQYPNIRTVTGRLSEIELLNLLRESHCMVYPSRGEGFGITPLEAMATGIPAIVPNAHGISEYFNSNYMLEVKIDGSCPGLYSRFKGQDVGNMVIADIKDLRKQMRFAFNNQAQMKELGKSASEYAKNYTYKRTAEKLAEILKKWEASETTKRKDSNYLKVEQL